MSAGRGMLLHGERWNVATLDRATRSEMARRIEELEQIGVVRSVTTGPDVSDENVLIVLIVLMSVDVLESYRSQPVYRSMSEFIQPLGLYPAELVQFNLELPVEAPSLRPHQGLLLHGSKVDVSTIDEEARTEIIDRMLELEQIEFVRSATAGLDTFDANAITQVMVLDNVERFREYPEHQLCSAMASFIAAKKLPTVSFSLELGDPPW
jgi:hypothetical protein